MSTSPTTSHNLLSHTPSPIKDTTHESHMQLSPTLERIKTLPPPSSPENNRCFSTLEISDTTSHSQASKDEDYYTTTANRLTINYTSYPHLTKTSNYPCTDTTNTTHRLQTTHRGKTSNPNLFEDYPDISPRDATSVLRLRARAKLKNKNRTKRKKTNPSMKTKSRIPALKTATTTHPTTSTYPPPALKTLIPAEAEAERINLFQEVIRIFKPG